MGMIILYKQRGAYFIVCLFPWIHFASYINRPKRSQDEEGGSGGEAKTTQNTIA